jgi:hypothetical protein
MQNDTHDDAWAESLSRWRLIRTDAYAHINDQEPEAMMPSSHRKVVGRPVDASYACLAEICEDCGTEWPCREGLEEENERLRSKLAETEAYWEECQTEHHKLNVENERLRAEAKAQGTQDFTDVLYRATFAEAKIEAALALLDERLRCGEIDADIYEDMSRALRGGDDES